MCPPFYDFHHLFQSKKERPAFLTKIFIGHLRCLDLQEILDEVLFAFAVTPNIATGYGNVTLAKGHN
jgi:hypothetical protein